MPTLNDTLRDRAIRHALYLLRIGNAEAAAMVEFINTQLLPSVAAELARRLARIDARGYDLGPQTTARLEALEASLRTIVADHVGEAQAEFLVRMRQLAASEGQFAIGVISAESPVELDTTMPSPAQLRAAALERPFEGEAIKDWFGQLTKNTQDELVREMRVGIAQGDTLDQLVTRIRGTKAQNYTDGVFQATRAEASAIAHSAVVHTSTQARERTYEENSDLISGVQWISTLDTRTCIECASRDGEEFEVGQGPRPPLHFNCRCTTVPIVKSWKALGIDLPEAPDGTRASMDGQVSDSITYDDWLRGQPRQVIEDALGPSRADLFIDGGLEIQQFTNPRGQMLTLEQLQRVEGDAFEAAGAGPGG